MSDLRFDGRSSASAAIVASDGSDFLVLSRQSSGGIMRTFAQKVANGIAAGPHRQIGVGEPVGLAWTGSHYLAAWQHPFRLWVAPVSRDGSPLATPTEWILQAQAVRIAADHQSALAFGYNGTQLVVQPLDLEGRRVGSAVTHTAPIANAYFRTSVAAGGFAAVFSGNDGTWMMLFRADGTSVTASPIVIDGPYTNGYKSSDAIAATGGGDTLVLAGTGKDGTIGELKTVVVDANGVVKSTRTIETTPGGSAYSTRPQGLVWDGSQYIAALHSGQTVRISSSGELIGDLVSTDRRPTNGLAWNGDELLLPYEYLNTCTVADAVTLTKKGTVQLGRTLASQGGTALGAGTDSYLAAWFEYGETERTVRASRIDASGRYLDGEGILLGTLPATPQTHYLGMTIAIDSHGPQWMVVWSDGENVVGRAITRGGVLIGASPFPIGTGQQAAIRWNGAQYIVLRSDLGLHLDVLNPAGSVLETKTLAPHITNDGDETFYEQPHLARLSDRMVSVYAKVDAKHLGVPGSYDIQSTILRQRVDVDDTPVVVAENAGWDLAVAEGPEGASAPFVKTGNADMSATFDGTHFVLAFPSDDAFITHRYSPDETLIDVKIRRLEVGESATSGAIAASNTLAPLVALGIRHNAYDSVARATLLFNDEIPGLPVIPPPPAPSIINATKNAHGTITVRWQPMADIHGIAIELELPDGTFREIGVANAGATSARVETAGLDGNRVRVRAWNHGGISEPSSVASITFNGRHRAARR